MKKFEYFIMTAHGIETYILYADLNKFGQEGWEICGVDRDMRFFLKRELVEETPEERIKRRLETNPNVG